MYVLLTNAIVMTTSVTHPRNKEFN